MATKRIIIHYKDQEVQVELKSAKKADGIFRGELMGKAVSLDQSQGRSMVAFYLYPTCIASVLEPQWLRGISLDDFIDHVDEVDMDLWVEEAYNLNPQWKASMRMLADIKPEVLDEVEQKKTGTPLNGSKEPMQVLSPPEIYQALKS